MNNISPEGRFNDLDKIQKSLTKDLKGVGLSFAYIQNSTFGCQSAIADITLLPTAYQLFFGPYYNFYRVNKYGFNRSV